MANPSLCVLIKFVLINKKSVPHFVVDINWPYDMIRPVVSITITITGLSVGLKLNTENIHTENGEKYRKIQKNTLK